MANGVRFIRVHGRVVPVRDKGSNQKTKQKDKRNVEKSTGSKKGSYRERNPNALDRAGRFVNGAIFGAAWGALSGAVVGGAGAKILNTIGKHGLDVGKSAALSAAVNGAFKAVTTSIYGATTNAKVGYIKKKK